MQTVGHFDGDDDGDDDIDNTLWNQMAWHGAWLRPSLGRDNRVLDMLLYDGNYHGNYGNYEQTTVISFYGKSYIGMMTTDRATK